MPYSSGLLADGEGCEFWWQAPIRRPAGLRLPTGSTAPVLPVLKVDELLAPSSHL